MSDLIDRQAALDAIRSIKAITGTSDDAILLIDKAEAQTELVMLPSAQETHEKRTKTHSCDYISRQAAIDALGDMVMNWTDSDYELGQLNQWKADRKAIIDLPSAQPQRMKGRWIYGEHDIAMCDGYRCDKCGFFVPWDYKYTFIDFINDYHFCPNCGADMRGEEDAAD